MHESARRAPPTMSHDWLPVGQPTIQGLQIREVRNVVYRNGVLTELFRSEWFDPPFSVAHAVYVAMLPQSSSTWHCHAHQQDVLFPVQGQLRLGFYDDREDSPTYRTSLVVNASIMRPTYVVVPPGVWHALRNPTHEAAAYVVFNDQPYVYDAPDDWILPVGADAIPCSLD
jgi:dTDP-4-dehydrorhamnose 3,5-epimerase